MGYLYGLKALLEIVNSALAEYLLVAVLAGYTLYSFWGKVHSTARVHKTTFLLLLATLVCFGWSFFQNAGFDSLRIVGKYLSCVLIFFLVSVELGEEKKTRDFFEVIWKTYHILFYISLLMILLGPGRIVWGNTLTLRGAYFYKTDYAAFLFQFMILCRLKFTGAGLEKDRIQPYPLALILFSSGLIVFTNSRIYLPLLLIYYFLLLCEYRDLPVQKLFRLRYVAALLALGILGMVLLTFIPKWFPQLHWIGLNFEDGILTGSNTQGRNQIWRNVLGYFFEAPWGHRLFGVDLVSTPAASGLDLLSHNSFVYILFSFGYIGTAVFLVFFAYILRIIYRCRNGFLSYTLLLTVLCFWVTSFSQDNIIFTQQTAFLYMVLAAASRMLVEKEKRRPRLPGTAGMPVRAPGAR